MTKNPWERGLPQLQHKFVLIACFVLIGQGAVWYSRQFWSLYYPAVGFQDGPADHGLHPGSRAAEAGVTSTT
jgi:hypothetical protein